MLTRLIEMFLDKKRIVSLVSGVVLAVLALVAGMQTSEFKDAVCSAPVIEPKPAAPAAAPLK